jgi:hypothetical protein
MRRCPWYPLARRIKPQPSDLRSGRLVVLPREHAYDGAQLAEAAARGRARVTSAGPRIEPAQFDRAAPRWHARLCTALQLSTSEAQLALAALNALPGPGVATAAEALAAICLGQGLDMAARVIQGWLETRSRKRSDRLRDKGAGQRLPTRRCGRERCELGSVERNQAPLRGHRQSVTFSSDSAVSQ